MSLTIVKFRNFKVPALPYRRAAERALGRSYELDLIFATGAAMKNLNKFYRKSDQSTNVLSFALTPKSGQLVFDLSLVKKEAAALGIAFRKHLWRLFAHGIFHLKGWRHSRRMAAAEFKLQKSFRI